MILERYIEVHIGANTQIDIERRHHAKRDPLFVHRVEQFVTHDEARREPRYFAIGTRTREHITDVCPVIEDEREVFVRGAQIPVRIDTHDDIAARLGQERVGIELGLNPASELGGDPEDVPDAREHLLRIECAVRVAIERRVGEDLAGIEFAVAIEVERRVQRNLIVVGERVEIAIGTRAIAHAMVCHGVLRELEHTRVVALVRDPRGEPVVCDIGVGEVHKARARRVRHHGSVPV